MSASYSEKISGEPVILVYFGEAEDIFRQDNFRRELDANVVVRANISDMEDTGFLDSDDIVIVDVSDVTDDDLKKYFEDFSARLPDLYRIVVDRDAQYRSKARQSILSNQNLHLYTDSFSDTFSDLRKKVLEFVDQKRAILRGETEVSNLNIDDLSSKLKEVADSLDDLRINSVARHTDELRQIANVLSGGTESNGNQPVTIRSLLKSALIIMGEIIEAVGNSKIAKFAVCGAIGYIVGLGGWPATLSYGVTLGALHDKEAFLEAVRSLPTAMSGMGRGRNTGSSPAKKKTPARKK